RRLAPPAAPPAAPLPRRVRLLPLGRRPGRRSGRRPPRGGIAPLVACGAAGLLRWAGQAPGDGGSLTDGLPLPHPARALPGSAGRLRAGPAGQALRYLSPAARLLPQLGQPGGPAGALPVRGFR